MKRKLLFLTLVSAAFGGSLRAQKSFSNPVGANITVADAGTCSTVNSFLWQQLPNNAGTTSINLAGTFVATVTIRESNNGGGTWTTATTLSAAGTTTFSTNGFTDICADVTAFTSGTVQVSLSTGLLQVQSVVSGGSSSSASVSNPAPNMGFYLTNACTSGAAAQTLQCFNTFADTQQVNDCGWTNASTTITCVSAHFVAADVGKSVMGARTCSGDTTQAIATAGGIVNSGTASPTITQVTDSTHIVISATPLNTVAQTGTAPIGGCLTWGHIDDTAFAATDAAMQAISGSCPRLFLAAANYWITKPFFFTPPTGCLAIGPELGGGTGNPGFGTTTLPAGFEIEGRGTGNTAWYLDTLFPNGDACTHVPTPSAVGTHTGGCFVIPVMGAWRDFRIDGGGQGGTAGGALAGKTLIYMAVAKMKDFLCLNYGGYSGTTSIGIELSFLNQLDLVNNSGCGDVGIFVDSGVSGNVLNRVIVESSAFNALAIFGPSGSNEPNVICYYCNFASANSSTLSPNAVVQNRGGKLKMFGGRIYTNNGNSGANTNNGISGYLCQTTSGCDLYAEGVTFTDGSGGGSNTNGGILCTIACTNTLINSILKSQSSGSDYTDVANSVLNDLGGNSFTPRLTVLGANKHTESGTCTFAAATTCAATFNRTYGATAPSFFVPPNIVGTATTLTVSALSATGATITASASNSGSVNWTAVQ